MGQLSVIGSIVLYVFTFGLSAIFSRVRMSSSFVRFLLIILPPVVLATFRYNVGYDYNSYIVAYYNSFATSYESIFSNYSFGDPIAYYLLTKTASLFGSERIFLLILALFALVPGVAYIVKQWDSAESQPFMIFIFLFSPFIFSMSACKQGIALSILMYSLTYVYERKLIKFVLCVAVAFFFHSTAIVFVLVYLFINAEKDVPVYKKVFIVLGCIIVIMNLAFILGNVMDGKYESYALNTVEGKNRTFWLYSAMALLFIIFRKKLIEIDEKNDLLIMMIIIGALCQYLGFSNAFAKRIGEYFTMTEVILIPQCVKLFTEDSKKIANALIVVYVVAIFLISTPIATSGMGFVPYQYKFW